MTAAKEDIINQLRQDILQWEGFRPPQPGSTGSIGLGPVENAFPHGVFPTGAIHEFASLCPEDTAACGGFVAGLVKTLLDQGGACLWISWSRRIYPPSLKLFGVEPDRVVFVDVPQMKDVLWVTEEALKCEGVAAVICEVNQMSFMESRRLQLAVEQSHVTGFVIQKGAKKFGATASVARWRITQVPSQLRSGMPGVGFPRWQVDLLKVRNGNPGSWTIEWSERRFTAIIPQASVETVRQYA
ncbi:Error-prone repair protein ImuA [Mucilaginibacter sp. cycad4]|uniref:ImuA family protein n=1 Tax=unclassified Mucilaginibacter TaxID=2617802 RepID=UPI002AAB0C50|nr:Error-prone repair protein ImuA [Mucilaginibacter gossypii]WPU99202.1 Error-prone repair protein ImuA [Mucilaginibacter gossypii]